MTWLTPRSPYRAILVHIKSKGIKVFHRKIKSGAGGLFNHQTMIITIDKEYKDTWDGCYFLAHELVHFTQHREGNFKRFFADERDLTLEEIIEAEMDAVRGAVKMLKLWGIQYTPKEFSEEGYNESVKFWKEYYGK